MQAAYLQKGGLQTAVLERRHVLGGAAVTEELFPGKVEAMSCQNTITICSLRVQNRFCINNA